MSLRVYESETNSSERKRNRTIGSTLRETRPVHHSDVILFWQVDIALSWRVAASSSTLTVS